MNVNMSTTKIS